MLNWLKTKYRHESLSVRVPMVLNGKTSVPWKVEIKYSTMAGFHYGNTERYPLERWTKDIWWFEAFCLPFSDTKGPLRAPEGPQWFSMDKQVCHEKSNEIFYYGRISLWEYWALLTWEVDKGTFADLLLFSGTEDPPKGPHGSPTVLNGQTSVPWEVEIKYSTMG